MLKGKIVILGVTGGIAAYKAVELLRLLTKAGAVVHVIMTKAATEFVAPLTFQTLSGNPVHLELFNLISEQEIGHISLADRADLFLVAPATANFIGKVANGIADDLLTTTIMATKAPVLIAPAMNCNMFDNPIYQENEQKLRSSGYRFVDPVTGQLACGWEGKGKMQEPVVICEAAIALLARQDLAGETVLVTAGPTREEIDPVRFVSNHSSGKMGYAIARAARRRGAKVILVSGPVCLESPYGVETVRVKTAVEMRDAVMSRVAEAGIVVKSAAVADYRPVKRAGSKIKKSDGALSIELEKNPDILAEIGQSKQGAIVVGFAAETDDLLANAGKKLEKKNLDMIVANDIGEPGAGFDLDTNIVRILYRDGRVEEPGIMSKDNLADFIIDRILLLKSRSSD
ncbi:bifunctional phosphopantothenoylcysteine decarboxylase/phosphopantothenate--cysteine ligase CoaBC [Geobacter pelophilus]|uniref:Coenzyme A biosynthesis bifunctional protein CoaBC n=1 Tax=Geoanaerobacter pelophilus TaxID=60036 RepID=A0AAW4KY55_9BACT|nr:bifunctional phosphopantothenoylcysteine decarboxylase/phosphopantothenate--cysteine ligase CoaBC [Geoanaerobacter pelophilus]MBT0662837.1 bifunctional phosphopantothenoylcysteine decarboxylase/phosphopantothenate--cysteine ligase CoaBC [Geoanaerobacter pelophilus]